ncbi:unnamed protein product [Auanema sp. JU1783]|nr:unnamed protein product [Auanema sp. JU1783]
MSRYLENPYFHDEASGASTVDDAWIRSQIKLIGRILSREQLTPKYLRYSHAYSGTAGVAYALFKAKDYLDEECLNQAVKHIRGTIFDDESHETQRRHFYLTGYIGSLTIYGHDTTADMDKISKDLTVLSEVFADPNFEQDEIFNGRAGYLQAVNTLRHATNKPVVSEDIVLSIIDQIVISGKRYGRTESPLMYSYHGTEYLGAAHGLAGILCTLYCFFDLLTLEQITLVRQASEWLLKTQFPNGNFPSSLRTFIKPKASPQIHWCHGAPGVVYVALFMYKYFKVENYLEIAISSGELIWKEGVLKKGPGLCHGISGNAYPFIYLWRATNDRKWLQRAKCFAKLMMDSNIVRQQDLIEAERYSLFEGWGGAICLLVDLLNPKSAQFPLITMVDI